MSTMAPDRDMDYVEADILTARELASRLKWNVSTVYRTPLPYLPKGRTGRTYYWPDVLKYLRSATNSHGGSR